jgi:hypothetical protein
MMPWYDVILHDLIWYNMIELIWYYIALEKTGEARYWKLKLFSFWFSFPLSFCFFVLLFHFSFCCFCFSHLPKFLLVLLEGWSTMKWQINNGQFEHRKSENQNGKKTWTNKKTNTNEHLKLKMHILSPNQNVANQNHEDQFWERKNMTTKK